ncbi:acetylcholine receptor subunit delta-like isoform X2 [Paramacrobiotus metropolitanus]|uniref:acetylcholine receptor subunit delta-like isoform X2 n=1 Tax=Paramacrobiotus metropolitanus TaxID=2943436 RepID=UPI002445F67C|nr:acetylcholine receptor subunit delta-like isoform X2 [Paramacrobiotus metropolitanus]
MQLQKRGFGNYFVLYIAAFWLASIRASLLPSSEGSDVDADHEDVEMDGEMVDSAEEEVTMSAAPVYGAFLVGEDRRPRLADGQSINVSMSISLRGIMDVSEYQGYITINAEMGFKWYDPRLQWDAAKFSNLTVIPVSDGEIYHPNIYLLNSWNAKESNAFAPAVAMVYNTGKVLWYPRATLKAPCFVDTRYWPFTAMECDLVFGSPLINDHEVRLYFHTNAVYVRSYMEGHQWRLVKGGQFMVPENMDDLRRKYGKELPWIRLYFEHRPCQFLYTIALASIVMAVASGLLFACMTDVRISMIMGVMEIIFFAGLHFYLSFMMPPSSKTPLFGIFITDTMLLVTILLFFTYIIAFLQSRTSSPPKIVAAASRVMNVLSCNAGVPSKPLSLLPTSGPEIIHIHREIWRQFAAFLKLVVVILYMLCILVLSLVAVTPFMEKLKTRWEVERAALSSVRPLT